MKNYYIRKQKFKHIFQIIIKMKFSLLTIAILASIISTIASTCPRVPTLDFEKVNLDQVK